jgi:predicted nucleotidyltransferase component of viral defense system
MATLIQTLQNILSQKESLLPNETKRVVLKEVLQAYTLSFLYNHPQYRNLNFYGGTCLHMLYGLNRLSEDIDFDNSNRIDLSNLKEDLLSYFRTKIGYSEVTAKNQKGEWGIQRITLKFPVLYALGLTSHINESLHLKVEVSQHQQISVICKTPVLVYGQSLVSAHFSLETMMAGKMLACLERNFKKGSSSVTVKGRDFYDLLWFMQQKIHPLEEKLAKDGQQPYTLQSAMHALSKRVAKLKTSDLAVDLLPLFENRTFIKAWLDGFHENFVGYYKYYM